MANGIDGLVVYLQNYAANMNKELIVVDEKTPGEIIYFKYNDNLFKVTLLYRILGSPSIDMRELENIQYKWVIALM
jgi:hypothetical protein